MFAIFGIFLNENFYWYFEFYFQDNFMLKITPSKLARTQVNLQILQLGFAKAQLVG